LGFPWYRSLQFPPFASEIRGIDNVNKSPIACSTVRYSIFESQPETNTNNRNMKNQKLNGFLGIPFGSNQELVIEKLIEKHGKLDEGNSNKDVLFFDGITFGGRQTEFLLVTFYDDQFTKACVYIKPAFESEVVETYIQIKNEINGKYYVSHRDFETYHPPYKQNDGFTESAISLGKARFGCFWNFGDSGISEDYITVQIEKNLEILISYEDGPLMDLFVQSKEEKDSLDY